MFFLGELVLIEINDAYKAIRGSNELRRDFMKLLFINQLRRVAQFRNHIKEITILGMIMSLLFSCKVEEKQNKFIPEEFNEILELSLSMSEIDMDSINIYHCYENNICIDSLTHFFRTYMSNIYDENKSDSILNAFIQLEPLKISRQLTNNFSEINLIKDTASVNRYTIISEPYFFDKQRVLYTTSSIDKENLRTNKWIFYLRYDSGKYVMQGSYSLNRGLLYKFEY